MAGANKREVLALVRILTDPENEDRSAEEVADLCVSALDDVRARSHRLAVVGQIQYRPQEPAQTVVLGPFSARGTLDSQEKFLTAIQGGTAAREAGQHLAWDTKTGTGKGRFMLAPAFRTGRDAYDFFRGQGPAEDIAQAVTQIRSPHFGPVCACGLVPTAACQWCGLAYERHCPLHDPEAEVHQCRPAA